MNPTVCAVMLANGRAEMVARAIASFRAQTYQEKRLFILDTSPEPLPIMQMNGVDVEHWILGDPRGIGALRNMANGYAGPQCLNAEIILHWDSDDFSHPNRIAEQVALLQSSGADCVGYREMLFWRAPRQHDFIRLTPREQAGYTREEQGRELYGEAWLYSHLMPTYALGTSLCYWRRVWEANPFIDGNQEDWHFVQKVRTVGVSAIKAPIGFEWEYSQTAPPKFVRVGMMETDQPRMIASIHGSNTCSKIEAGCDEWRRVPEWDAHCQRTMEGA